MNLQDRFDTALELVKQKLNLSQAGISKLLRRKGIRNASEGGIARAKSKLDEDNVNKISDGVLSNRKLKPLVKGLEEILEEVNVNLSKDETFYYDSDKKLRYDYIYKGRLSAQVNKGIKGILDVHDKLPRMLIQDAIKRAKSVRILQTFMTSIEDYTESIQECLRNGGAIKILLLNPRGTVAKIRTRSFIDKSVNVEEKVLQNFKMLEELSPGLGVLELRFYDELPGLEMVAIDDRIFCGWHLFKQLAMNGAYLELVNYQVSVLAKKINQHWEELWDHSVPMKSSWRESYENEERFRGHFLREGRYCTFDIFINKLTYEVLITNTGSGEGVQRAF